MRGKSHLRDRENNNVLRFGSRKSGKLVRCYVKQNLGVYRIELELHSRLLRKHGIRYEDDLLRLGSLIYPDHFQLVDLDWAKLKKYLCRKLGPYSGCEILRLTKSRVNSIQRVARFLSRRNVCNPHRFFLPLEINIQIESALKEWTRSFARDAQCATRN